MKDKAMIVEQLFGKVESYVKTTLELYRLKAIDKITDVFATIASSIIIGVIIALCFILLSVGLALYLGSILGKNYYGFFALAGVYGVIAVLMVVNKRKWIEIHLNNFLIKQIFKEKKNVSDK